MMSNESKIKTKSPNESPDSPKHKRIKMGEERSKDNLDRKDNSSERITRTKQEAPQDDKKDLKIVPIFIDENDKVHYESTTYTTSTRDKSNISIAKKEEIRSVIDKICSRCVKRNCKTKSTGCPPDKASTSIADKRGDKTFVGGVESHVAIHK
jgi:hypothetical protein